MWKHVILLFPFFACLFWACLLFMERKKNNPAQNLWMGQSLFAAILCGFWAFCISELAAGQYYMLEVVVGVACLSYLYNFFRIVRGGNTYGQRESRELQKELLILVALLVVCATGRFYGESFFYEVCFLMFALGVTEFYMGYHVYRLRYVSSGEMELTLTRQELSIEDEPLLLHPVGDEKLIEAKGDLQKKYSELALAVGNLMAGEKLYLQHDLRMMDIARRLKTNRTYISRTIHEEFGCSYSFYISRLRVEYAKNLMRNCPTMTQEQVAEKSGFMYATVFSRAFKEHTGLTFREWQKQSLIQ